jgi:hypothetical protein
VYALSGTSTVALSLVIIALAVAFVLTFVVGRLVLLVLRVMLAGALCMAILIALVE